MFGYTMRNKYIYIYIYIYEFEKNYLFSLTFGDLKPSNNLFFQKKLNVILAFME
jgi:hypothetical protein